MVHQVGRWVQAQVGLNVKGTNAQGDGSHAAKAGYQERASRQTEECLYLWHDEEDWMEAEEGTMSESMPPLHLGKDFLLMMCVKEHCQEHRVPYETLLPFPPTGIQCFRCGSDCEVKPT